MNALRDYTDIRQLTPEIVNALIRCIEVRSKDKETKKGQGGHTSQSLGYSLFLRKKRCRRQWRRFAKPHSSSNFLHKAEHGATPFQRLHRIPHKTSLSARIIIRIGLV